MTRPKAHPDEKLHRVIYVWNWIGAAVFAAAALVVFWVLHVRQIAIIRGTVDNLPPNYQIKQLNNSDDFSLYSRREGSNRWHWLVAGEHRMDNTSLSIEISEILDSNATSGYDYEIALPVESSFYEQPVEVIYERDKGYALRVQGRPEKLLTATKISLIHSLPLLQPRNNSVVYAATVPDAVAMKSRLEAPDSEIRREARDELAKSGADAVPFINGVLEDSRSSPALQFGVLSALTLMGSIPTESLLSGKALANLIHLTSGTNPDIAGAAKTYITQKTPLVLHKSLQAWLISNQNHGKRLGDVALADMDLLYDYGTMTSEAYHRTQNAKLLALAVDAFSQGWSDRRFAESADQVYFAKALYGWGLLLANRATWEEKRTGQKNPQLVQAAKDKLGEFLKASGQGTSSSSYSDQDDIARARSYLKKL